MIKAGAISILLLSVVTVAYSQSVTVSGNYLDHKSNPIPNVSVKYFQNIVLIDSTTTASNGDFALTIPTVGTVNEDQVPADYHLSQNYPNPFNPTTRIDVSTPERGSVTIYNILGQVVDRVKLPSAGIFTLTWGGGNAYGKQVSAGIYFYVLHAGDYTQVRKMTLMDKGNGTRLGIVSSRKSGTRQQLSKTQSWDDLAFTKPNTSTLLLNLETPVVDTSLGIITGNVGPELIHDIPDTMVIEGDTLFMNWDQYFYNDNTTFYDESIYTAPHAGLYNMQVTATDSVDTTLTAISNVFIVEVYHINLPPILNFPDTLNLYEDQDPGYLLGLTDYSSDPENDTLTYSITYQQHPGQVNLTVQGDSLLLDSLQLNWNGISWTHVSVSDGEYSASDSAVVEVQPVNDAPENFNPIPDLNGFEDGSIVILPLDYFRDVDNNDLEYYLTGLDEYGLTWRNDSLFFSIPENVNGTFPGLQLVAQDGEYNIPSNIFSATFAPVDDAPQIDVPNQNIAEDSAIDTLVNLLDVSSDVDEDGLIFSITEQSNPELVNLIINNNQLMMDSLQADSSGSSLIGVRAFDGTLADTSYFTLTVDPRADITFIMKDICADTVMSTGTSQFFFDGVEYTSSNGILTRQLEPESIEFDATNPNSIDGMEGTFGGTYLMLRHPGMINNFEERDRFDTSSPINPGIQDTTIICYKIPADFDIANARYYMDRYGMGTIRVGDNDLFGPAWYNTGWTVNPSGDSIYVGIPDDSTRAWQQELFGILPNATGKLNLQYLEQDTAPGELGTDFYHETYFHPSIQHPEHGEDWNANNEITYAQVRGGLGTTKYTRWSETLQSLGIRYGDPSGILQTVDDVLILTHKGNQWLRVLYQTNTGFHL